MEELYRNERVIPNEALRKLLEKPLESKINTEILRQDVVIDIELSKDTSSEAEELKSQEEQALKSWKELKEKLLNDSEKDISVDDGLTEEEQTPRDLSGGDILSEQDVQDCLGTISESALNVTKGTEEITTELFSPNANLSKPKTRKSSELTKFFELITEDSFYARFALLLFGIMTLGLFTGLFAGILVIKLL